MFSVFKISCKFRVKLNVQFGANFDQKHDDFKVTF